MSILYSTLQSNIASMLSRSDLTTQIQEAIKRAVRFYERDLFWFNRSEDSFIGSSTPKRAFTVSATNTLLQITQVVVNYNSARYELVPENLETIKAWDSNNLNGLPHRWAYDPNGRLITFDTNLNVTATVSYTFIKKMPTLSVAGDSNEFTDNASDLIEARACWWLYLTKIKNKPAADAMKEEELNQLSSLKGETAFQTSSGRVTPTKF